jgi:hypothetical protein
MILAIILLVLGVVCLTGAVVLTVRPWRWTIAAVAAFAGLCLLHWSKYIYLPLKTFIFWGIATLIVVGITRLSPKGEPDGKNTSNLYIGVSALAGCLLGILVSARIMILGVVLGAIIGQIAYSRTPDGKWMKFPTSTFIKYFCAKSLQVIVTVSMIGIAVEGFIF